MTKITRIALDFDSTFSAQPELFMRMVEHAPSHNTLIVFVTMRFMDAVTGQDESLKPFIPSYSPVIYAGRLAKQTFVEKMGYKFDIWIDDSPHFLFQEAWHEISNPTDGHAKNLWREPQFVDSRTTPGHLTSMVDSILTTGRLRPESEADWELFKQRHLRK